MITDPLPRTEARRREYVESDDRARLALPASEPVQQAAAGLGLAVTTGEAPSVRRAAQALADQITTFFAVQPVDVRVLGVRPHRVVEGVCAYELHGDYTPETRRVRVWLRTAMRGRISSPKAFLSTLLHEVAHHLDVEGLGLPRSYHTRGFFTRVDDLYHLSLATPPAARRPLVWVRYGSRWRIDWRRSKTANSSKAP